MPDSLIVLAAGSLRAALTDFAAQWDGEPPHLRFGPAGLLRQEIERGEACDIYLSANTVHPEALARRVGVPWRVFARNPLRVVTRPGTNVRSETLLTYLLDPATRLGTSTPGADPSGDYAQAFFDRAEAAQPSAGGALRTKAAAVVGATIPGPGAAPKEHGIAQLIAEGVIDAFIGYRTSALALGAAVDVITPSPELSVTATYALVVLRPGLEADRFADALSGPRGRAALAPHGFDPA